MTSALFVGVEILSTIVDPTKDVVFTVVPLYVESNFRYVQSWRYVVPPVTTEPFLKTWLLNLSICFWRIVCAWVSSRAWTAYPGLNSTRRNFLSSS